MKKQNKCPYCSHPFISNDVNGEKTRIIILYFIKEGVKNSYALSKKTNHAYSLINKYVKELEKKGLIKFHNKKSNFGRPSINLSLTKKSTEILKRIERRLSQ